MLNMTKTKLKHVAGGNISVVGSCWLSFQVDGHRCVEEVFFITGVTNIFLSLSPCKALSIVHEDFPQVIQLETHITEEQEEPALFGGHPGDVKPPIKIGVYQVAKINIPVKPTDLPFTPVEENIPKLEGWLVETFKEVFATETYPLRTMSGKPQHIHVKSDAIPQAIHSPISVPSHWREDVRKLLERDIQLEIIEKVPVGEPVDWCCRMVTVRKKDGSPRITVDFQHLNKSCLRETHPSMYINWDGTSITHQRQH